MTIDGIFWIIKLPLIIGLNGVAIALVICAIKDAWRY